MSKTMSAKKKINSIENETKVMLKSLQSSLANTVLTYIFRDLLWGIIRFKEKKLDDSLKYFREFVEHSHRYLFNNLNPLLQNPIILQRKELNDKTFVIKLKDIIFPELNIKNISLLKITRKTFLDGNIYFHEIIPEAKKPIDKIPLLKVINNCIKLFLLVEIIASLPEKTIINNTKEKSIYEKYPTVFKNRNHLEILEIFLNHIFGTEIRDLIFEKHLITSDNIKNSKLLQKYYPLIVIEIFKIQNVLDSKKVIYFRPDGPHLIDYKEGNWIFVPEITTEIISSLKNEKSILLEGQSGTGKTIISRFIGYNFLENGYNVFYINCLEYNLEEIKDLIDHLIFYTSIKSQDDDLFIFDNIHSLKKDTLKRLKIVKENLLCLFTQRIFSLEENDKEEVNLFSEDEIIRIDVDSTEFNNIVRGILKVNNLPDAVIDNLISMNLKNLWMLGFFLKLTIEAKDKSSFFEILTDFEKLEREITRYFQILMESKHLTYSSSEKLDYLNHLKYLISIMAIFSDFEIWTEAPFIYSIFEINDNSVLGEINRNFKYDKNILKSILSFLIDIFEIRNREGKNKKSLSHFEFSIPHSQMARIYKNSFLFLLEDDYKGLTEKIIDRYIFTGKFYGTFKYNKKQLLHSNRAEDYRETQKKLDEEFESFYLRLTDPTVLNFLSDGLKLLRKQILDWGIDEAQYFLDSLPYKHDGQNTLYRKFYELIFDEDKFLLSESWRRCLLDCNYKGIFYFIREIQEFLGDEKFEKYINQFSEEIINQFKESDELQLLNLIFLAIDCSQEVWNNYFKSLKRFLVDKKIGFKILISLDQRASNKLDKIDHTHPKYLDIKEIILESFKTSSVKEDLQFLYNYERNKLFIDMYLEFLQNSSNQEIIKKKVKELNLFDYTTFISNLYNINPSISKVFFEKYHEGIKDKIQEAEHFPFSNFLIEIQHLEYDEDLIKSILLKDWNWFFGILEQFKFQDLVQISNELVNFFKNMFPECLRDFEEKHFTILKSKIDAIYEEIPIKVNIIKILDEYRLKGEIRHYILELFEKSLRNSLPNQDFKFYLNIFDEISRKTMSREFIVENFNFEGLISIDGFKEILNKAKVDDIVNFGYILRYFGPWHEIFYKKFDNQLEARFGENYEDLLTYNKTGRLFYKELPYYVLNLEIEKLNTIYFSTFDRPEDELFVKLHELIDNNQELFINEPFQVKISTLPVSSILDFLILLDMHHSTLFEKIKLRFKEQIKNKFESNPLKVENLLSILNILEKDASYFQALDLRLFDEPTLLLKTIEAFQGLDLFSLRYIIDYFIDSKRFDDIADIVSNLNIEKMVENSSLLEISLGIYFFPLNLVREGVDKETPHHFLGGFNVYLSDELFSHMTRYANHLIKVNYSWSRRSDNFLLYGLRKNQIEIILKDFNLFAKVIINKMREASFVDIITFIQSLISLRMDLQKTIFNPPDEFSDFFYSDYFKNFLQNEIPENIFHFFRAFSAIYTDKARKLWIDKKNNIETDALFIELELDRLFELFYFAYYENYSSIPARSLELLKEKIKELEFHELIRVLLRIDFVLLEVFLSLFENEIKEKVLNLSKYEILKEFEPEDSIMFLPTYGKQLDLIKTRIPVIQKKIDEKYIHE